MSPWPPHLYLANAPAPRADGTENLPALRGNPPESGHLCPPRPDAIEDPRFQRALEQAHAVQQRGLPAILTLNHLAVRAGVPHGTLRTYVGRGTDPYLVFHIRKHSGGFRTICVPDWPLARVQRWLATRLLNHVRPHSNSFAYAPDTSIVRCARMHCGCRWLVKMDISRFFESISEIQVCRVFRQLGYRPLVAFQLARL